MATPQRPYPDEASKRPERVPDRPADEPARRAGRSWFWIWIVLFIAAIIWFAGWGFGGYGGWWWGRAHGPTVTQPSNPGGTTTAPPNNH